jgi:hypothetical protein
MGCYTIQYTITRRGVCYRSTITLIKLHQFASAHITSMCLDTVQTCSTGPHPKQSLINTDMSNMPNIHALSYTYHIPAQSPIHHVKSTTYLIKF